jgi:phosphatidylglycerol:prolipoprotein diacylglycerol transferase
MDFTHVLNSGAAFGFLNGVDFPFKTVVIAVIATAALIGVGVYAANLAHHQIVARLGLALIIGGAAGNLIDRLVSGSVVDFVDVYWGTHHFWAFKRRRFGDLGWRRDHDSRHAQRSIGAAGRHETRNGARALQASGICFQRLFEAGPITVYTYGVLLAAAYPARAAARPGPRQGARARRQPGPRPRHLHHHRRADRREAAAARHRLPHLLVEPARIADAGAVRRRVLRRADSRGRRRARLYPEDRAAVVDDVRCVRAGIALGHVVGRFGCLFAGCCFGKPTTLPWGITFTDPFAAANVGHAARRAAAPDAALRGRRRALILGILLATERKGGRSGPDFWLYMLLYAISRFIIEFFRGDDRGAVGMFSTSQFISILLAPLAVVMLVYLARRPTPEPKRARKAA